MTGWNIWYLFRAVLIVAIAMVSLSAPNAATTLGTLYNFTGGSGGGYSYSNLISDGSGALYGTTAYGGNATCTHGGIPSGCGTVFKLAPPLTAGGAWTETVLYSFTGGSDGGFPEAGLTFGNDGALYGTTLAGGNTNCGSGCGTVFKLTPPLTAGGAWIETVLYTFTGSTDGAAPKAGLIMDDLGALYGTTMGSGTFGCGTIFKLIPPMTAGDVWTETVLHSFNCSDGYLPRGKLISGADGALYGTTSLGGIFGEDGTVFKLTPPTTGSGAWTETVLDSFDGSDGSQPLSGLVMDRAGALYGTTSGGGPGGHGTVFKLTPPLTAGDAWTETMLYSFNGGDGALPSASLIIGKSGALYGTTFEGGNITTVCGDGCGMVFKLVPPTITGGAWTENTLYDFTGGSDGSHPDASLISDPSGTLYGTTSGGDSGDYGTVFKLMTTATFSGTAGAANCIGKSVSALARQYGGLAHAAAALDYSGIQALQSAIATYCGG